MRNARFFRTAALSLATAAPAFGQVTDFYVDVTPATGSSGPVVLNDFFLGFDGRYTGSEVVVELAAGSIHQQDRSAFGDGRTAPSDLERSFNPFAGVDTYFTHGGAAGEQTFGSPVFLGGPVDIEPSQIALVDTPSDLGYTWAARFETNAIVDQRDFQVMRLALTPDAQGTIRFLASADGAFSDHSVSFVQEFQITDGQVFGGWSPGPSGDYNRNGRVEQGDLDLVLQHWGKDADVTGVPDGWDRHPPDGQVAQSELDFVLTRWGNVVGLPGNNADLDNSGQVDQGDVDFLLLNWGDDRQPDGILGLAYYDTLLFSDWGVGPFSPNTVPEPAMLSLVCGLCLTIRRRPTATPPRSPALTRSEG